MAPLKKAPKKPVKSAASAMYAFAEDQSYTAEDLRKYAAKLLDRRVPVKAVRKGV